MASARFAAWNLILPHYSRGSDSGPLSLFRPPLSRVSPLAAVVVYSFFCQAHLFRLTYGSLYLSRRHEETIKR